MLYKLTLRIALTNVAIISRLIKGNEYENYMLISLVNVKHELRRQLHNAKNSQQINLWNPPQYLGEIGRASCRERV